MSFSRASSWAADLTDEYLLDCKFSLSLWYALNFFIDMGNGSKLNNGRERCGERNLMKCFFNTF